MTISLHLRLCGLALALCHTVRAEPVPADVPPGHSQHGGAFHEGPRRILPLKDGMGPVQFPVTTTNPEAQRYFNQGVAQLHGFWYWEAERSFRTVLNLDAGCVMAYWGLAMANIENPERVREFLKTMKPEALEKVTPREKAWIDSAQKFFAETKNDDEKKRAAREHVRALEAIAVDYDDLEARAFAAGMTWRNGYRAGVEISSHLAVDALAQQVLAKEPAHPVHHYLIHLWDHEKPARALKAAALCGPSAPAVAHMWHMPGHIYSDLERWSDAAWQMEAAARVDHAQMLERRIYPDQIHNFAHNSEWLVRNLNHLGRVKQALTVAKNMVEMPRIPWSDKPSDKPQQKFKEDGSTWRLGRNRLMETILRWELWSDALALADTPWLTGGDFEDQLKRAHLLGLAAFEKGDAPAGVKRLAELEALEKEPRAEGSAAAEKARTEAEKGGKSPEEVNKAMAEALKPSTKKIERLQAFAEELRLLQDLAEGRTEAAAVKLKAAKEVNPHRKIRYFQRLGDHEKAVDAARDFADRNGKQAQPAALLAEALWLAGKKDEALKEFASLRKLCGAADQDLPVLQRLRPLADAANAPADWREPAAPASDIGQRPPLDSLGSLRWHAWPEPAWTAVTRDGQPVSRESLQGRPHVILCFLGAACQHCSEQLAAFSAKAAEFEKAGIAVVALSTDTPAQIAASGAPPAFPVHSGADTAAFKAFDAWDDFENKPLHATAFVDAAGIVRWQHTGYEPFMLPDFLLEEIQRFREMDAAGAVEVAGGGQ